MARVSRGSAATRRRGAIATRPVSTCPCERVFAGDALEHDAIGVLVRLDVTGGLARPPYDVPVHRDRPCFAQQRDRDDARGGRGSGDGQDEELVVAAQDQRAAGRFYRPPAPPPGARARACRVRRPGTTSRCGALEQRIAGCAPRGVSRDPIRLPSSGNDNIGHSPVTPGGTLTHSRRACGVARPVQLREGKGEYPDGRPS
jgi:hypothetical protein